MLGFVPQPNLRLSTIYHDMIPRGETQQIDKASFRSTTNLVNKDCELNNLNNITRLLARLLRCVEAHIRKVCDRQRALNTNQNPSQSLFNLFRPQSLAPMHPAWLRCESSEYA